MSSSCLTVRSSCLCINLWSPSSSCSCVVEQAPPGIALLNTFCIVWRWRVAGVALSHNLVRRRHCVGYFRATRSFPFVEPLWRPTCDCLQKPLTSFHSSSRSTVLSVWCMLFHAPLHTTIPLKVAPTNTCFILSVKNILYSKKQIYWLWSWFKRFWDSVCKINCTCNTFLLAIPLLLPQRLRGACTV